jgi:hypothetical protein
MDNNYVLNAINGIDKSDGSINCGLASPAGQGRFWPVHMAIVCAVRVVTVLKTLFRTSLPRHFFIFSVAKAVNPALYNEDLNSCSCYVANYFAE